MTNSTPWETRNMLSRQKPLTPGEVAALFNVDPKTVTRWANSGRLVSFTTPGGHRRFQVDEVRKLMVRLGLKIEGL